MIWLAFLILSDDGIHPSLQRSDRTCAGLIFYPPRSPKKHVKSKISPKIDEFPKTNSR